MSREVKSAAASGFFSALDIYQDLRRDGDGTATPLTLPVQTHKPP